MRIVLVTLLAAAPVYADPCEPTELKATAAKVLGKHPVFSIYCPSCGDRAPSAPERASEILVHYGGAATLNVNGDDHEMSAIYVQTSPYHYANLAALAGCVPQGTVASLRVAGETPNGVMIYPDDEPIAQPPRAPDPIVVVAPPAIVAVHTPASPWPWLGGGLAGALGSIATIALVVRRKRHRAQLPRALGLAPMPVT